MKKFKRLLRNSWGTNEGMESIYKHTISSRQKNRLTDVQRGVLANSNAISTAHGKFSELTADVKKLIGLQNKKLLTAGTVKSYRKMSSKEIIQQ